MKNLWPQSLAAIKKAFKTEHSRFLLFTGFKVSGISLVINAIVYLLLFQVMRLNYAFFSANGFADSVKDSSLFYEYLITETYESIPVLLGFHVLLFFIGSYLGWIILKPFRDIGDYCEVVLDNPNAIYKVEDFSNYKLLTRFSEFFFEYLREARKTGKISPNSIPPQFSRIHKPVTDKIFMLHFGLLLIIIGIISIAFIIQNANAIFSNMVELATKTLPSSKVSNQYFTHQIFILSDIIYVTIFLIVVSYLSLGLHLYSKVSGAAFGIFSTMRAFMKGNYFSRVHLVGFAYLRDYTRKLNKYLDYIEKNFDKENPKG